MSTQIGYSKSNLLSNPSIGVFGQAANYVGTEIVPRSSSDATGIRRLYLAEQGGEEDDNAVTVLTFEFGVGWSSEELLVDGTVTELKEAVIADFPDIANYTLLTDDETTELKNTIAAYVLPS